MPQTTPNHNKNPSQKKNWTQNKFQRESRVGNQCKKGGGGGNEERKMGLKVGGYLLLHSEQSSFLYQKNTGENSSKDINSTTLYITKNRQKPRFLRMKLTNEPMVR